MHLEPVQCNKKATEVRSPGTTTKRSKPLLTTTYIHGAPSGTEGPSIKCFILRAVHDSTDAVAECRRIDAFQLCCWRRLLRVPWTARRSNQSILKEISPDNIHRKDWCWSWNSNPLETWCEELTHWKRPWCWERLKAGREGDNRGWDGWMASPTRCTWVWASSRSWWQTGRPAVLQSMGSQRVGTQLSD